MADASGVSNATIKRMEDVDGIPNSLADNLQKIARVLGAAGVEFIPENGGRAGVRMAKVDFMVVNAAEAGIIVRHVPTGHRYAFAVETTGHGARLFKGEATHASQAAQDPVGFRKQAREFADKYLQATL